MEVCSVSLIGFRIGARAAAAPQGPIVCPVCGAIGRGRDRLETAAAGIAWLRLADWPVGRAQRVHVR